jgi:DNA-binding NtrC family response regulator
MKNLRILVVDDDPVIRKLLEERLRKANHHVDVAEDGYVAERLLQQKQYDLVLTDLMMPGEIGGIEVLEIAKEADNTVEVLLITAHSSVGTAVEAMKKGAADYLEKPINFDELFLRLDKIASLQSILQSARDLRDAMSTTEGEASSTIQTLELQLARFQEALDRVEDTLRSDHLLDDIKIEKALEIISET